MNRHPYRSRSFWRWPARPRKSWVARWISSCVVLSRNRRTVSHASIFSPLRSAFMETDQLGRLRDILEASRLIESYMKDTSEAQFRADTQKQDAVVRRIEIIGEATAHLSDETRREIAALPFRKMRGMRNIVAHDYANVDLGIVWQVATVHVLKSASHWRRSFPRRSHLRRLLLE